MDCLSGDIVRYARACPYFKVFTDNGFGTDFAEKLKRQF